MSHFGFICIIAICLLIALANAIGDEDCLEYMSDLQQKDDDDCTSDEDTVTSEKTQSDSSWLDIYSYKDGEFSEFSEGWLNNDFNMFLFSKNKSTDNCFCKNTYCRCNDRKLKHVPQDLPLNTTKLDLFTNRISDLPNCTFCNYTHLTYLDLSANKLTHLNVGSFWGLRNLTYLNIQRNSLLYMEHNFPLGVFLDLKSLRCLKLNLNIPKASRSKFAYPDRVLAELINLRTLYIDGIFSVHFGEHFRNLKDLRTLVLGGFSWSPCNIVNLSENSFKNVEQISTLNISYCKIQGIASSKYAFDPLVNLVRLDVSFNEDYGVRNVLQALNSVREYNITTLKMNYLESMLSPSIVIDSVMMQSLPRSLRYLEAQGNNFIFINQGALQLLPPNLTYIEAGGNIFMYGEYFQDLRFIKSIQILKLNGGLFIRPIPSKVFSFPGNKQFLTDTYNYRKIEQLIFYLPPTLLCLSMRLSGLRYLLTKLTFHENNSLESLVLTNNYFPIMKGPIKGLSKLQKLYLSDSNVKVIESSMFKYSISLKELRLNNNKLNFLIRYYSGYSFFRYLKNLEILDLSSNLLTSIHERLLENLTNLKELDLSHNNIDQFNLTLDKMLRLRRLSLGHNHLSSLSKATRSNIDWLLQTNHSIRVYMPYNPIRCDCNNIDFIKWMVNSQAFENFFKNYMCQYEDTSTKMISDSYEETLRFLAVKCADHSTLFLVVISATLFMIFIVVVAVLYRFRWKLRYLYHAAYIMMKEKKKDQGEAENFRYDVFISYASEDEEYILEKILPEFNQRELKVIVHGRDFAVGEFIASNIVTAVKESRKTLVVLTRHLLNSTWCNFEIQMANMESVHKGRPVLVFLIKEAIPTAEMSAELLYHIKRNTYIEYPEGEVTQVFWDKLAQDIQTV